MLPSTYILPLSMDSAAVTSLTPFFDGIDRWVEIAPVLPLIIILELLLSADNAIALASITKGLENINQQKIALNIGISLSLFLRIILILTPQFVLRYAFVQLIAAIYLISIFLNKIYRNTFSRDLKTKDLQNSQKDLSLITTISLLALTDLAFSIDSLAAAVAISDQFLLVVTGAIIGVLALRFTSGIFIKLLDIYTRLELSGYIAVGFVGFKMLILLTFKSISFPEWIFYIFMLLIFAWGFSFKKESYQ